MKKYFLVFLAMLHLGLGALFVTNQASGSNAAMHEFPLDDSWILMVYARSIAEHGAPYYNDGQLEAGFTSPLWMLLAAVAHGIHELIPSLDLVYLLKALGILIAFLGSWAVFALTQRLVAGTASPGRANQWIAAFAATLHAITPQLAFSQVSGMEVSLAGGLGIFALVRLHDRAYASAGWALAASYWARPEMGLLFAIVLGFALLEWKLSALRERRADLLRLAGPMLLLAGVWAAACYAIWGGFVPTTATAKLSPQKWSDWGNFIAEVVWPTPSNFLLAGAVLAFAGYAAWLRKRQTAALVALAFPWIFFLAVGATRAMPKNCDLWFYYARYGLPGLPMLFVAMGAGLGFLWDEIQEPGRRRTIFRGLALFLGALALVAHPKALAARAAIYSYNCKNIGELQVRIGHWIAENTPKDAVIASHDAGAIRYFGERPVMDYIGLNEQTVAKDLRMRAEILTFPQSMVDYMNERRAQYLVMAPTFFPRFINHPQFAELFEPVFMAESSPYTLGGSGIHTKMGVWKLR